MMDIHTIAVLSEGPELFRRFCRCVENTGTTAEKKVIINYRYFCSIYYIYKIYFSYDAATSGRFSLGSKAIWIVTVTI